MKFDDTGIFSDAHHLMLQAPRTIEEYVDGAQKVLDRAFGKGYAKSNPQLVAAFISAAALDFATSIAACSHQDLSDKLDCALQLFKDGINLLQNLNDNATD